MGKIILILLGSAGFLWFLLPFLTKRILNIGNGTGLLVCALLCAGGVFYDPILTTVHHASDSPPGRGVLFAVCLFCCLAAGMLLLLSFQIFLAAHSVPSRDGTVVVLGCRVYGKKASLMLEERIFAASRYLKAHPKAPCICTGGKGEDEDISEALCIYENLRKLGIQKERLYLETLSVSTMENLTNAGEILKEAHLPSHIILVTNEFHLYRSLHTARRLRLDASGLPAKTAWWLFPTYFVRELYAVVFYWLKYRK